MCIKYQWDNSGCPRLSLLQHHQVTGYAWMRLGAGVGLGLKP